jgi:hypothetical protein
VTRLPSTGRRGLFAGARSVAEWGAQRVDGCEVSSEQQGVGWLGPDGSGQRGVVVFVPRKFHAKDISGVGGDLWGYLQGGREQVD